MNFIKYIEVERIPEYWKNAFNVLLYKSEGYYNEFTNYRRISLLGVPSKIFRKLLIDRVVENSVE